MSASTWHSVADIGIGVCWGSFAIVWVLGTLYNARHAPAVRRRTLGNVQWLVIAVTAWVGLRLIPGSDWNRVSVHAWWTRWPGLALLVAATAFTIWSRFSLGTMWSSDVVAREGHRLRTDGPYAIVRHPIYAGLLGMLLGSALLDGLERWTPALVGGGALVLLKVRAEERLLGEIFPGEYERYRRRVSALVPLARRRRPLLRGDGRPRKQADERPRPLGQIRPAGARDHVRPPRPAPRPGNDEADVLLRLDL
jgi:protein-S-isoprenylcysteine O-methyltransferase Ste14